MNIKISLIISAYNEEKYIGACLEYAIKNSGDYLYEIIVVDNASTDATRAVAEKYIPLCKNLKIVTESRKGVTRARERGFRESSGELLAFIDADTRMPVGWVEQIKDEFTKNKDLGFLTGPYDYYDMNKIQRFGSSLYWRFLVFPMSLAVGYVGVGGNFAIKRDVLEKMHGFDTDIEFYGDDTNTARRAKKFGKTKFSLRFIMPTSARRLNKQGNFNTIGTYVTTFLSEAILHKQFVKKHEDYR